MLLENLIRAQKTAQWPAHFVFYRPVPLYFIPIQPAVAIVNYALSSVTSCLRNYFATLRCHPSLKRLFTHTSLFTRKYFYEDALKIINSKETGTANGNL